MQVDMPGIEMLFNFYKLHNFFICSYLRVDTPGIEMLFNFYKLNLKMKYFLHFCK